MRKYVRVGRGWVGGFDGDGDGGIKEGERGWLANIYFELKAIYIFKFEICDLKISI